MLVTRAKSGNRQASDVTTFKVNSVLKPVEYQGYRSKLKVTGPDFYTVSQKKPDPYYVLK